MSVEFFNLGGCLANGNLPLESQAHFLVVAEHRLFPVRARSVTTQLRRAGISDVSAPTCQDTTPADIAPPRSSHICCSFLKNHSLNRDVQFGPSCHWVNGGVAHLFVVYGCQGAENDLDKLFALTGDLLKSVLGDVLVSLKCWLVA